jgi:hypothetical protein
MKMKWFRREVVLSLVITLVLGVASMAAAQAPAKAALTTDDCVKCHTAPPADIETAGGKHKTITCFDCHASHRPASKDNIPQCNQCHSGKPHYELKGCLGCHKNPHTPLKITFASNVTDACLTCHSQQIKQLRENKSKHTNLACAGCHSMHRVIPQCVQCHKPHSAEMTQADCKSCHKAHMPKVVTYGDNIPNKSCGACHKKAMDLLAASKSKHSKLACVFCHASKHKTVPTCESCHGAPHAAGIMQKFPKCADCHFIAHDLNNWSVTKNEAAPEPKKEKSKKK